MFSQEELANRLQDIADRMYKGDPDTPYLSEKEGEVVEMSCAEDGVITAMVTELCRSLECPIHTVWNSCKIESYTPQRTSYETVCFEIRGDHAYYISDSHTKQHIARSRLTEPVPQNQEILGKLRRASAGPSAADWESFDGVRQGHFGTEDLQGMRTRLHQEGSVIRRHDDPQMAEGRRCMHALR